MPVSYVLINVEPGSEEEVLKEVSKASECEGLPPNLRYLRHDCTSRS